MLEKTEGQSRMDNPEKLATLTQDEDNPEKQATLSTQETRRRQNKIYGTTQYVLETTLMQTKTNKVDTTNNCKHQPTSIFIQKSYISQYETKNVTMHIKTTQQKT